MHTLFAIVTVVYNAEEIIQRTIESVLYQIDTNYQYLIMDGASKDNTVEVAKTYIERFKKRQVDYRIISEPDTGIFNAMNKSIKYVDADYILFLNAGDMLCTNETLYLIESNVCKKRYDVIYGDYYLYFKNRRKYIISKKVDELRKGMITSHQAILTSTKLFEKNEYKDDLYKMAADYEFYLRMYEMNADFCQLRFPVVYFESGGQSQRQAIITQFDVLNIKINHSVLSKAFMPIYMVKVVVVCIKKAILNSLPEKIRYSRYEKY